MKIRPQSFVLALGLAMTGYVIGLVACGSSSSSGGDGGTEGGGSSTSSGSSGSSSSNGGSTSSSGASSSSSGASGSSSGASSSSSGGSTSSSGASSSSSSGGSTSSSGASSSGSGGSSSGGNGMTVMVGPNGQLAFQPSTLTINVGDTVTWIWAASGHSVTSGTNCAADNAFCSPNDTNCAQGATSNSGAMYTHTFTTAGTFSYFCTPHCGAGMTGSVTVQ